MLSEERQVPSATKSLSGALEQVSTGGAKQNVLSSLNVLFVFGRWFSLPFFFRFLFVALVVLPLRNENKARKGEDLCSGETGGGPSTHVFAEAPTFPMAM